MAKETLSSKAKGNQEMAGAECARDEAMIENVMYLTDHQFNEIRIMAGKINVMGEFLRWTNPLDFYTGLEKWDINNLQALAACNGNVGSRGVRGRFTKNRPYTPPKKKKRGHLQCTSVANIGKLYRWFSF